MNRRATARAYRPASQRPPGDGGHPTDPARQCGRRGARAVAVVALSAAALLYLTGCIFGGGGGKSRKLAGPLDGYPPSPALDTVARDHADAGRDARDPLMVLTTWFLDGDPRVAMMCRISPDGRVRTYQYVHGDALKNTKAGDLVPDQLSAVQAAVGQLPASQKPPLDRVLLVSFRRGSEWVTRTYDRTAPPGPVAELFSITGAPIQPKVVAADGAY